MIHCHQRSLLAFCWCLLFEHEVDRGRASQTDHAPIRGDGRSRACSRPASRRPAAGGAGTAGRRRAQARGGADRDRRRADPRTRSGPARPRQRGRSRRSLDSLPDRAPGRSPARHLRRAGDPAHQPRSESPERARRSLQPGQEGPARPGSGRDGRARTVAGHSR